MSDITKPVILDETGQDIVTAINAVAAAIGSGGGGGTITGSGVPTAETIGLVGSLYMDTDTGEVYKCVDDADGVYTWEALLPENAPIDILDESRLERGGYISTTGVFTISNTNWESFAISPNYSEIRYECYSDTIGHLSAAFYSSTDRTEETFISGIAIPYENTAQGTKASIVIRQEDIPKNTVSILLANRKGTGTDILLEVVEKDRVDELSDKLDKAMVKPADNVWANVPNNNDFCFIKDEIWFTQHYQVDGVYHTYIHRYKFVDGELVKVGELDTDFGHCNTLNYCEQTDCLIFGNGANDTNTEGNYFAVIKNPLALSGTVALANVATVYNVNIGYKVQAVWGDNNLGQYNIVYLISNAKEIRKALLLKDSNGNFNGNLVMLGEAHTMTTTIGIQGVTYFDGYLYICFGDGAYKFSRVSITDYTEEVVQHHYYNAEGTEKSGTYQGIAVDNDYIWLFANQAYDATATEYNWLIRQVR